MPSGLAFVNAAKHLVGWDDRKYSLTGSTNSSASSQLNMPTGLDYGQLVNTGDTALDSQILGNSAYQRTFNDIKATGMNPTWLLSNGGSIAGTSASGVINSSATKQDLKIAQQNADSNTLTAKASMVNAIANSAKALASNRLAFGGSKSNVVSISRVLTSMI